MKANRKHRALRRDEAVSPVIAVILMVAITVVLSASVYVWVTGFRGGHTASTKSLSLNSATAVSDGFKNYTVIASTPGLRWIDLRFTLDGEPISYDETLLTPGNADDLDACVSVGSTCVAGSAFPETLVRAGDTLVIYRADISGATLRAIDETSNSVIFTVKVV